jgi:hypothetical protein
VKHNLVIPFNVQVDARDRIVRDESCNGIGDGASVSLVSYLTYKLSSSN